MIEAINLSKRFEDGKLAVDAINLRIEKEEIFCLLGANGAGKTTTINLFLNFLKPTKGFAKINNIDVTQFPLEAMKHISYVSENVMLYGNFSARQNLDFFAKLGGKTNLTKEDYYMILRKVGLQEDAFEKKIKKLSKGMRQKVGLSIAIIKDAGNIFLDEPTSGLDPKAAAEFIDILKELRKQGKSILMCTHDVFRAKELADNVGIMKEGRILKIMKRTEFLNENLESIYLNYMREPTIL